MLLEKIIRTNPANDLDSLSLSDPSGSGLKFEKEVIYVGNHEKKVDEEAVVQFSVDEALIDHWVKTSKEFAELGVEIPMPNEHTTNPEMKRAAVLSFSKKKDSKGRKALYVVGEFVDEQAKQNLKTSQVSLHTEKSYSIAGKDFDWPIVHVAFTSHPIVNDTDALTISASMSKKEPEKPMESLLELAQSMKIEGAENMSDAELCKAISASAATPNPKLVQRKKKVAAKKSPAPRTEESDGNVTDPHMRSLLLSARSTQIDSLNRKFTKAELDDLKAEWADSEDESLTLSVDSQAAFDSMMRTMSRVPDRIEFSNSGSSRTGGQSGIGGAPARKDGEESALKANLRRQGKLAEQRR